MLLCSPDSLQRPLRMLSHDGIGIFSHLFQLRKEFFVAAVAHGDRDVPAQAGIARAFNRRTAKGPSISLHIHLRQPSQVGMEQILAWMKFRRLCRRSVAGFVVPGTDVLADV